MVVSCGESVWLQISVNIIHFCVGVCLANYFSISIMYKFATISCNTCHFAAFQEIGTVFPKIQFSLKNENVHIKCYSTALPTWVKDGQILNRGTVLNPLHEDDDYYIEDGHIAVVGYNLIIDHPTKEHEGSYICIGYKSGNKTFMAKAQVFVPGEDKWCLCG